MENELIESSIQKILKQVESISNTLSRLEKDVKVLDASSKAQLKLIHDDIKKIKRVVQ